MEFVHVLCHRTLGQEGDFLPQGMQTLEGKLGLEGPGNLTLDLPTPAPILVSGSVGP